MAMPKAEESGILSKQSHVISALQQPTLYENELKPTWMELSYPSPGICQSATR